MFRVVFLAVSAALSAAPAAAQVATTARIMGMGGAVRGDPVGNSAVVANPAGMSRSYIYAAQAGYVRGEPGGLNSVGANIVDSKTQPSLAVGMAYAYQFADSDQVDDNGHDARVAFAHPVIPQVFNLGLGLHYLHLDRGAGEVKDELRAFTLDAGLLYSPTPAIHIGVVGHNLIQADDPSLPLQAGGGLAFTGELFTLDVDVLADFDRGEDPGVVVAAGLEALLGGVVPFRFGYLYDAPVETQWLSGGLGFLDTRTRKEGNQLNVSYRQNLDDASLWQLAANIVFFL